MSSHHLGVGRPTLSADSENGYFLLSAPKPKLPSVRFSELLNECPTQYESAPIIQEPTLQQKKENTKEPICKHCHNFIGNKAYCYSCFGAQSDRNQMATSSRHIFVWKLVGLSISLLMLACLIMCIMHIGNIGIYKDDNISKLQKKMDMVLPLVRYLMTFNNGFSKETTRNITSLFKTVTELKTQHETFYKRLHNIEVFIRIICKEESFLSQFSSVEGSCNQVNNGTLFQKFAKKMITYISERP